LKGPPTTNAEIRQWYRDELAKIPKLNQQWVKEGIALDVRAKMAWKFRHDKRREARLFMQDANEIEMLRLRDTKVYGSPNGPTFKFLIKRLKSECLSENEVYEAIIKGSYRTNAGIDKMLGF
jgi:hypothetical protein